MGWRALAKDGTIYSEEKDGRPVQLGEKGQLAVISQDDFGHSVAIDLLNGIVAIDYTNLGIQNGTVEIENPRMIFWIAHETYIVGELHGIKSRLDPFMEPDETGELKQRIDETTKELVFTRTDTIIPLKWRPIWFTRWINGVPTKIIGAQTTLPADYGRKNVKKMIILYPDGRLGIH